MVDVVWIGKKIIAIGVWCGECCNILLIDSSAE